MDLKEIAEEVRDYFETKERPPQKPGEEPTRFYFLKDHRPLWLVDFIRDEIHEGGSWFPDDFKYDTVVEVLDALSEGQDPDELNLEADVYVSDLVAWLSSHNERAGLVDEATEQFGHSKDGVIGDISLGQWYEKDQIARMVFDVLKEHHDDEEWEMEDVREPRPKTGPKEWSPRTKRKRRGKKA